MILQLAMGRATCQAATAAAVNCVLVADKGTLHACCCSAWMMPGIDPHSCIIQLPEGLAEAMSCVAPDLADRVVWSVHKSKMAPTWRCVVSRLQPLQTSKKRGWRCGCIPVVIMVHAQLLCPISGTAACVYIDCCVPSMIEQQVFAEDLHAKHRHAICTACHRAPPCSFTGNAQLQLNTLQCLVWYATYTLGYTYQQRHAERCSRPMRAHAQSCALPNRSSVICSVSFGMKTTQ